MSIWKPFCIAFSMFSNIPIPQFKWEEKDMRYMIIFFPVVGIIIGAITYLWGMFCFRFSIGSVCFALIGTVLPLFISGGIHIDGYMDTMDALYSYQEKEKKLKILEDPHIGAFSVIKLVLYYLVFAGAYSEIDSMRGLALLGAGFYLSRILSAVGAVSFLCAKKEGLLYLFSSQSDKVMVRVCLYLQLAICAGFLFWVSPWTGSSIFLSSILALGYYWRKCRKKFGGVTGDTSGYFTTICEAVIVVVTAVGCVGKFV